MNLKVKINKLLFALQQLGFYYRINETKVFSENKNKYYKKFQLYIRMEKEEINKETGEKELKKKYIKVLDTFDEVKLLKYLASDLEDYKKEIGGDADVSGKDDG